MKKIFLVLLFVLLLCTSCHKKQEVEPLIYQRVDEVTEQPSNYLDLNSDEHIEASTKQAETSYCKKFNDPSEFKSLVGWQELNKDVVGLLKVNNREFPIMKDASYLARDVEGQDDIFGTPFITSGESSSLIYGHSVYGDNNYDLMFTFIKNYMDKEFWKDHKTFILENEDGEQKYLIVALMDVDLNEGEYQGWQDTNVDKVELISWVKKDALELFFDGLSYSDKLVFLVTCDTAKANARYVLVAKQA